MGLLLRSFLRRGWLRAAAAGVAVGFTLIAVLSYRVIAGEMSSRLTWGLSGGMPADVSVVLPVEEFTLDDQARIAAMPGVAGCEFREPLLRLRPSPGLALKPPIGDAMIIAGPWWLIIVAGALPVLTALVLSLVMKPAVRYEQ